MIVSNSHGFIFIKTRKSASSSMEAALRPYTGPGDVVTPMEPEAEDMREARGEPPPRGYEHPAWRQDLHRALGRRGKKILGLKRHRFEPHEPARSIRRKLGSEAFDALFKVSVVRNPYDYLVSLYMHERSFGRVPAEVSFAEYVRSDLVGVRNVDLCAIDGRLALDGVIRYEHLLEDAEAIADRLGLGGALAVRLSRQGVNRGFRASKDVAAFYSEDLRSHVARAYADEFRLFGYDPQILPENSP